MITRTVKIKLHILHFDKSFFFLSFSLSPSLSLFLELLFLRLEFIRAKNKRKRGVTTSSPLNALFLSERRRGRQLYIRWDGKTRIPFSIQTRAHANEFYKCPFRENTRVFRRFGCVNPAGFEDARWVIGGRERNFHPPVPCAGHPLARHSVCVHLAHSAARLRKNRAKQTQLI